MARHKQVLPGHMVQFRQVFGHRDDVIPFLVTHVHVDGSVSGVAFSGEPGAMGWNNRASQAFPHVMQGRENRQWQPMGKQFEMPDDPMPEPEPSEESYHMPEGEPPLSDPEEDNEDDENAKFPEE